MKSISRFRYKSFRFKRWNRAAYSVFCSVGRCVTIGHVCEGIVERALQKQHVKTDLSVNVFVFDSTTDTENDDGSVVVPMDVLREVATLQVASDVVARRVENAFRKFFRSQTIKFIII